MKNLLTVLGLGGLGWFLWEGVTEAIWWEIAKWVGTGVGTLIVLAIMIRVIRDRAEKREAEREISKVSKMHPKQTPMHPQIMYMPAPAPYPQQAPQAPQAPAGLVDLPLDKYEWEI